ncbi:MAG: phage tail protein [Ruminococcus sp.]|nr:phage tail protein [Ruminococcus sp.]
METSTYMTFLMKGTVGTNDTITYSKLVDIKDNPEMEGAPEALDITTLSDGSRRSIPGIKGDNSAKDFTCNYDEDKYDEIKALEGTEQYLALYLGGTESNGVVTPTGSDGKFTFKGYVSIRLASGSVNAVRDMIVSVIPSTIIVKE